MMRREQTCGNQDGERRKKRERVWLSDSVNPGLGSLPLIPLFPLIKTAELPLISSLSLSLSPLSFYPFLLLLLLLILFFSLFSFFFLIFSSPKVHIDQPVGNHVCPRRVTLFISFFFFFLFLLLSRACSSFLPLSPCFFPSSESIISAMILEQ